MSNQWRHYKSGGGLLLLLAVVLSIGSASAANSQQVRYAGKPRTDYYVEVLQLALSYPSGRRYQLMASGLDVPKQRAFELMARRQGIDVVVRHRQRRAVGALPAGAFCVITWV